MIFLKFINMTNSKKFLLVRTLSKETFMITSIVFLLVVSSNSASPDTYDEIDIYIKNSNNHFWEATGDNIQHAIDDLNGGGTVWLPSGTFIISDSISMKNNIKLIGSGIGDTIVKASDDFTATDSGVIYSSELHNITLSNFTVDGNRKNAPLSACCIHLKTTIDFIIENVYLTSPAWNGLRLTTYCDRGLIQNVYSTDINGDYQGISVHQVDNCSFYDCVVWNSADNWGMDFSQAHNCDFDNLLVYDSAYGIKVIGQPSRQTEYCTFNNINMINIGPGDGFKIQQCKYSNFNNIRIEGGFNGFSIWYTCVDLDVNNVHVDSSINLGVSIQGSGHNINNVHVKNCEFYGFDICSSFDNIIVSIDQKITFIASGGFETPEPIASYDWDFGDGKTDSGISSSHIFETPGEYTIVLTAKDQSGRTFYRSKTITITSEDHEQQNFSLITLFLSIVLLIFLVCLSILLKIKKRKDDKSSIRSNNLSKKFTKTLNKDTNNVEIKIDKMLNSYKK